MHAPPLRLGLGLRLRLRLVCARTWGGVCPGLHSAIAQQQLHAHPTTHTYPYIYIYTLVLWVLSVRPSVCPLSRSTHTHTLPPTPRSASRTWSIRWASRRWAPLRTEWGQSKDNWPELRVAPRGRMGATEAHLARAGGSGALSRARAAMAGMPAMAKAQSQRS